MNVTIVVHGYYILHKAVLHKACMDSDHLNMNTITIEQITKKYREL